MNPRRCPHCGSVPNPVWTPATIIAAAAAWAAAHDGAAPKLLDWRKASPSNPSKTTVVDMFGSWNEMIVAAGLRPRRRGNQDAPEFTREQALNALLVFKFQHERLPGIRDWLNPAPGRPTAHQVRRLFGSWGAFIVAGGYSPSKTYRTGEGYKNQGNAASKRLKAAA